MDVIASATFREFPRLSCNSYRFPRALSCDKEAAVRRSKLLLLTVFAVSFFGCTPTLLQKEARRVNMRSRAYGELVRKANEGDKGAAERLAQLWYGEDNEKAVHWLQVAAQNGSGRAERLADVVEKVIE
jgi:hypothetical protein